MNGIQRMDSQSSRREKDMRELRLNRSKINSSLKHQQFNTSSSSDRNRNS